MIHEMQEESKWCGGCEKPKSTSKQFWERQMSCFRNTWKSEEDSDEIFESSYTKYTQQWLFPGRAGMNTTFASEGWCPECRIQLQWKPPMTESHIKENHKIHKVMHGLMPKYQAVHKCLRDKGVLLDDLYTVPHPWA